MRNSYGKYIFYILVLKEDVWGSIPFIDVQLFWVYKMFIFAISISTVLAEPSSQFVENEHKVYSVSSCLFIYQDCVRRRAWFKWWFLVLFLSICRCRKHNICFYLGFSFSQRLMKDWIHPHGILLLCTSFTLTYIYKFIC